MLDIRRLVSRGKTILHYHNKLDHMGFGALKDLAKRGFLPRKIACHIGKGIKRAAEKGTSIISDKIEKPGDLFHTDQAESTTPGRPMTASGKNNKNKIYYVTLFVDNISK